MKKQYHTSELAGLYEKQGYYTRALETYLFLLARDENNTRLSEAVHRIKSGMENEKTGNRAETESIDDVKIRIRQLCEEWVRLLIYDKNHSLCKIMQQVFL